MISKENAAPALMSLLQDCGLVGFTELQRLSPNEFIGHFDLPNGGCCQVLDEGVLLFEPAKFYTVTDNGAESGSDTEKILGVVDIVLSCGLHGNETGPIEMLAAIIDELLSGELFLGNRLLCILGNPLAVKQQRRFSQENLNRLFNGAHQNKSTYEAKRAAVLERHIDAFYEHSRSSSAMRIHYDLHTAIRRSKYPQFVIYPYPGEIGFETAGLTLFAQCGVRAVLLSHQPGNTFSYFSRHRFNAQSFTVELGEVKPFGENNAEDFSAIKQGLSRLVAVGECEVGSYREGDFTVFSVKHELLKRSEEFVLHLDDDVENFHKLPKGYQLTSDNDGGYNVETNDEFIVFPNAQVPVGQRVALIVEKTRLSSADNNSVRRKML